MTADLHRWLVDQYLAPKHATAPRLPLGTPFQAPPLPSHFVERSEASAALKVRLLADTTGVSGTLSVSIIHGLAGVGKSALAAALAHDSEANHFSDGILWTSLGQEPSLLSILGGWNQALGDHEFRPDLVEASSNHLRTLLQNKAMLLVVDDVWDSVHASPLSCWWIALPRAHHCPRQSDGSGTEVS